MKIIVIGRNGQLGWELQRTEQTLAHADTHEVHYFGSQELDITNELQVSKIFTKIQPDLVINAAAYTAVDKAETDLEQAYAVNEYGVKNIAKTCKELNAKMIHVSTDFVFDGTQNTPYLPTDKTNPVSVYGASKLAGEKQVQNILAGQASIVRTAWVYSEHGNNFVKTMLRLMAEKERLGVVYDQVGTPTWAKGLAIMIWSLANKMLQETSETHINVPTSIYHWTDAGVTSWYDFAMAIQEIALEKGLLEKKIPIRPIPATAYPTPATRPSFSVLDKTHAEAASGVKTEHWRESLVQVIESLTI